jgi:predicted nucleic-acid-binding protein
MQPLPLFFAADLETATKIADGLSQKSDRYLFIVVTVLLVGILLLALKYFMKRGEIYAEKLEKIVEQQNGTAKELAVCINRNTDALECNTEFFRRIEDKI